MKNIENCRFVEDQLLRWEEAYESGVDLSAEKLCQDRPELIGELERQIEALRSLGWLRKPIDGDTLKASGDATNSFLEQTQDLLANRYRFESFIAAGGFGEVWRAFDTELMRPVAIKRPKDKSSAVGSSMDSFMEEARRVATLKHSGIVPVYDIIRSRGSDDRPATCHIVSEYVDGGSLLSRIGQTDPTQAVAWIAEVAETLHYAHEAGLIHCDIKPSNILIDEQSHARLTDFGIARYVQDASEAPTVGTFFYIAPEMLKGEPATPKSDLFSLGIVFVELLTGRGPFDQAITDDIETRDTDGKTQNWDTGLPRIQPKLDAVNESLRDICERCLAHDPNDRWADGRQLADALRCVGGVSDPSNQMPSSVKQVPRSLNLAATLRIGKRGRIRITCLFVVLLLAGILYSRSRLPEESSPASTTASTTESDRSAVFTMYDPKTELSAPLKESRRLNLRGVESFNAGRFVESIPDFDRAIELNPNDASIYKHRSLAFAQSAQYENAIDDAKTAIGLDPIGKSQYEELLGMYYLGKAKNHADTKEFQAGLKAMNTAIRYLPTADHYHRRATIYFNSQQFERAIEDWTRAIELAPKESLYREYRARAIALAR